MFKTKEEKVVMGSVIGIIAAIAVIASVIHHWSPKVHVIAPTTQARSGNLNPGWKEGPLPPGTYLWGGAVVAGEGDKKYDGFYFADFAGDHVIIWKMLDGKSWSQRIEAKDVRYYNNGLDLPVKYETKGPPKKELP